MRCRKLLALILVATVTAACGGDDDATPGTTSTTAEDAPSTTAERSTTTTGAPSSRSAVTVLDPGAEPRRELRYRLEPGTADATTQRSEGTLVQDVAGQRQELAVPVTEVDVDHTVEDAGDGRFTAASTFGTARVMGGDPAAVAETERILQQLEGVTITTTSTDRGEVLDTTLDELPETGNPAFDMLSSSLLQQAASLAFPFPEEPVGIGARWSVTTEVEIGGLPIRAEYRMTMTRLDGDALDADLEATLTFLPGPVDLQGTAADVIGGELTGRGVARWDLSGQVVPRVEMEISGAATIEAQGTRLVQQQTQRTSVTSRGG